LVIVIGPLNDIRGQETQKLGETAICLSGKGDLGFNNVKNGKVKYIFCHPEDILDNKRIVELFKSECVKSRNIFLVADEANCILDWG
jgi:superfamily II DNA helicase RecQ